MHVTASSSWLSAVFCASSQHHSVSCCVSSHYGFVMSDRLGRNLLRYCARPSSLCTPADPGTAEETPSVSCRGLVSLVPWSLRNQQQQNCQLLLQRGASLQLVHAFLTGILLGLIGYQKACASTGIGRREC